MSGESLKARIEALSDPARDPDPVALEEVVEELFSALERGAVRAASRDDEGNWTVNSWVKSGILLAFRHGATEPMGGTDFASFHDRMLLPPRIVQPKDRIRLVPGGSAIRRGAFVARNVTIMPPAYINVGSYVDEGTMVDSHALVGSCAQIGKRVHLSAACQIGGVLEPIGARPVVIEDDVLVGGGCGVYEGVLVREGAVLGAGLILTASTPVYDLVNHRILRPRMESPLEIPEGAVVVPGTRRASGEFAAQEGLGLLCGLIVKYRDEATEARVTLENALREIPG